MKKLLPILLSAALAFSGCSAPDASAPADSAAAPAETTETTEATDTAAEAAFPVGTLYRMPSVFADDGGFNTGDAYYEIARFSDDIGSALILRTDYATMTQAPVCRVEGCTHDSEACPAFLPCWLRTELFVVDGTIYLLYYGMDEDTKLTLESEEELEALIKEMGMSEEEAAAQRAAHELDRQPSFLDKISPDGLRRERVFTLQEPLEPLDWNASFCYCDGSALYGVRYKFSLTEPDTGLRLDLATGRVDTFALLPTESILAASGNRFLTSRVVTDEPLPPDYGEMYATILQNAQVEYDLLDPATGDRVRLLSHPNDFYPVGLYSFLKLYNGHLYFMGTTPHEEYSKNDFWLEEYDIASGAVSRPYDPLPAMMTSCDNMGGLLPVGHSGEEPYQQMVEATDAGSAYWLFNAETADLTQITQTIYTDGYSMSVPPLAQTNDGRWLVGYQLHGSIDTARLDYGLIDPAAFLQGSEDYEYVAMWP